MYAHYGSMALILLVGCPLEAERNVDKPTDTAGASDTGDSACVAQTYWFDGDADGYGNADLSIEECTLPAGYADNFDDCDDAASGVNPGAVEVCDAVDNDCEGTVDESAIDAPVWYQDFDLDGFGNDDVSVASCAQPDGYVATGGDCYDLDSSVTTGETWFIDSDGDGWGAEPTAACDQPAGTVLVEGDCDDNDALTFPGAPELCNGLDEDCDAEIDEEATDLLTWYADHDGDGYGIEGETAMACEPPAGFVELPTDCDDTTTVISPAALETCSGLDEDCDGLIDADDPDMAGVAIWYLDSDGDGHGVPTDSVSACAQPVGYAFGADDCDDANANAFPGADETCDATDEDCDGDIDESAIDATLWYADADGDEYGDAGVSVTACEQPADYVDNSGDCDDNEGGTSPEGVESCDGFDEDCDGEIDEQVWYADTDGDGHGDPDSIDTTCIMPSGYSAVGDDCDDTRIDVSPRGAEACDGDTDEDCDGLIDDADSGVSGETVWYLDEDGDLWGGAGAVGACAAPAEFVALGGDCDDADATISPDGIEVCGGADEDCDTLTDDEDPDVLDTQEWYVDADGDGFGASSTTEACAQPGGYAETDDDCDDGESTVSPGGVEICDDGTDQDCDGADLVCTNGESYTTDWGSEMVAISAGSFTMGGGAGDPDGSYTDHVVTLSQDFWIGETEITRGQWESSPANASWTYNSVPTYPCTTSTSTDDCPADSMSWYDVAKYCNALSAQEGLTSCYLADGSDLAAAYLTDPYACPGYRMPTEAEWEYAAQAGQDTEFSGSNTVGAVAWYSGNAYSLGTHAHQVATLAPNAWGLYDMSGNVFEWANDWYSETYGGYGNGAAQTDPAGEPTSGLGRGLRGGAWERSADDVRVAVRRNYSPSNTSANIGFRLARSNPRVMTLQGIDFVNIEASTFEMGCTASQSGCLSNETLHTVTLTQDYYVSETEVTQAQFEEAMGYNPSYFTTCGDDCPVEQVNWYESAAFANVLSTAAGLELCYACTGSGASSVCSVAMHPYECDGYRLLTEAEWEGAARCGEDLLYAGSTVVDTVAWSSSNSSNTPHAVGGKMPNACGLYDMSGNVWEWTQDWYDALSSSAASDPVGAASGSYLVNRGGGWDYSAAFVRTAFRGYGIPTGTGADLGFRLARSNP